MKKAVIISALGVLALLGIFVNYIFLYLAMAALCPLMHFLGGHGEHSRSSRQSSQAGADDEELQKEKREACH